MASVSIKSGNLDFETEQGETMTLESIKGLIESASLLGVPMNAQITHLSFYYSNTTRVSISWRIEL